MIDNKKSKTIGLYSIYMGKKLDACFIDHNYALSAMDYTVGTCVIMNWGIHQGIVLVSIHLCYYGRGCFSLETATIQLRFTAT